MLSKSMSVKERIFHSVLFEILALLIVVLSSILLMAAEPLTMTGLAVVMLLAAMMWNYIYNLGFDHTFGFERIRRRLSLQVFHSLGFELGLLIATVPLIMWILEFAFEPVLVFAVGLVFFFLLYTIIFNYSYDHVRFKLMKKFSSSRDCSI